MAVSNAMKWNKWGSTPNLYTYRLNWVRRTWGWWDEWGVTALQTQDSKLSPVGLRPSTLTLGHGGCPQYSIFTVEQGGNILFLWNLNARAGDESAISDFPSRHQDRMGKREFNYDAVSLKKTLLAQLLYRQFIALHIITSRHVFNIHISTSKVCILLGASQQIRYGEQWINTQRFRISEV